MKAQTTAIVTILAVLGLVLASTSAITYSWWSDSEEADITVTTGYLDVDVDEDSFVIDGVEIDMTVNTNTVDNITSASFSGISNSLAVPYGSMEVEYDVTFSSNIDAKYFIGFSSNVDWMSVKSVTVDNGLVYNQWAQLMSESVTAHVVIEVAYSGNTPQNSVGVFTINNEITQLGKPIVEKDDNGKDIIKIRNSSELRGLAAEINSGVYKGKDVNVLVTNDIDLSGEDWDPIDLWGTVKSITISGTNLKDAKNPEYPAIINMTINGGGYIGFFSKSSVPLTMNNIVFESPCITTSASNAATIVAYQYSTTTLNNVDVIGGTVTSTAKLGTYLGGLVGFSVQNDGGKLYLKDCDVDGMVISGYHSIGGLVGITKRADCTTTMSIENCSSASELRYSATGGVGAHDFAAGSSGYSEPTYVGGNNVSDNKIVASVFINDVNDLKSFGDAVNGGTYDSKRVVFLMNDVDLEGIEWAPIGTSANVFKGTFDGQGNVISNLKVSGEDGVGFFGCVSGAKIVNLNIDGAELDGRACVAAIAGNAGKGSHFENITVTDVKINGGHYVGGIAGYGYVDIANCHVSEAVITVNPYDVDSTDAVKYDNGDKVGGIIGWHSNGYVSGCTVVDAEITAYRDVGGIVGYTNDENRMPVIEDNIVSDVTIIIDQKTNNYGDKPYYAGAILGRDATVGMDLDENVVDSCCIMTVDGEVLDNSITTSTAEQIVEALESGTNVILSSNVVIDSIVDIGKDATLDLNGFDIDFSANESRPFEVVPGAKLTIDATDSDVVCGKYGLVNLTGGDLKIIGGNFVNEVGNNGALLKVSGDEAITITLEGVNYKALTTDSGVLRTSGSNVTVNIIGGTYEAGMGFIVDKGSVNGATIKATSSANGMPAISAGDGVIIENCTIEGSHTAVGVSGGDTITVKNCIVKAPVDKYAFQVYGSGGTIYVENCDYTGMYGATGKINPGKVALIYIDDVKKYEKKGPA